MDFPPIICTYTDIFSLILDIKGKTRKICRYVYIHIAIVNKNRVSVKACLLKEAGRILNAYFSDLYKN